MKTVEERLKSYEPLWENWTYTGNFLGEGAMSSVFEIQSTAMGLQELAALKIITVKKDFRGEVKIPENALNEIRILQTLSGCPNIVHYHDNTQRKIFDENNELSGIDILIKMEKLTSLTEGSSLTENQVIKLAKDMCNALIHASKHGIIHRDIKPQNIFVDADGTYKLGDFGIAKIVSDISQHFTMNIGTLAYTAPEVRGNTSGIYDISSDIYSLGLVLYTFLNNGYLPFTNIGISLNEAISKRLIGASFPSPQNGSKNLKTIVMHACNNDLSRRYKSPEEMLEDLELLSTGGKKMVLDPFATLDANIDIADVVISPHVTSAPSPRDEAKPHTSYGEATATGGGLRINMKSSYSSTVPSPEKKEEAPDGLKTTGGGLRINMKSSYSSTVPSPEKKEEAPDGLKTTGGGLRINMKSSYSSVSKPLFEEKETPNINPTESTPSKAALEDTKEEQKEVKSFFSASPDL